ARQPARSVPASRRRRVEFRSCRPSMVRHYHFHRRPPEGYGHSAPGTWASQTVCHVKIDTVCPNCRLGLCPILYDDAVATRFLVDAAHGPSYYRPHPLTFRIPPMKPHLCILSLILPTGYVAAQDNRQVELKKGDRILFFGDSLTYYGGKDEPTKFVT